MSSQHNPNSGPPASLGPGARPVQAGEASPGSIIKEVAEIRSHYSVSVDSSILSVGYELNGRPRTYRIPFENIPMGSISRWLLYGGPSRSRVSGTFLIDAIRGAENMAGRILNQREAEGFAFHSSKRVLYSFSGSVMAFVVGYSLAWTGRKTMKFPFMTPKPSEKYENFPNRYLPILRGQYARLMWHITRGNIYAGIGLLVAGPVFGAMGDSSMMVGLYRDDRTKDTVMKMKGNFDRINSNRARAGNPSAQPATSEQQKEDTSGFGDQENQDYFNAPADDNSTYYNNNSGQNFEETFSESGSGTLAAETQSRQSASTTFSNKSSEVSRSVPQSQSQTTSKSSGQGFYFDEDDDASPTAGNDPDMNTPSPYQSSGSAWDRVRRGMPAPPNRQNRNDVANVPEGRPRISRSSPESQNDPYQSKADSFSFSSSEQERQLAKEQAQKEFDDMLDRERQESGSTDYNKSMNSVESGKEDDRSSAWDRVRRRD